MEHPRDLQDAEGGEGFIVAKEEDSRADEALFSSSRKRQGPRKRVSQACDKCRTRKDKCDGKKPICSNCATHGRDCTYEANVKKRGLPEGYVRGMEKLWGLTIREVNGAEDAVLLILTGDEGARVRGWNDDTQSENLVDAWRKSRISRELERLLPVLDSGVEGSKRKRVELDDAQPEKKFAHAEAGPGLSAIPAADTAGRATGSYSRKEHDVRRLSRSQSGISPFLVAEGNATTAYTNSMGTSSLTQNPTSPILPADTWQLLDIYFSYTHCWLPIVEKHDLLKTSHQYSQNGAGYSSFNSGDLAALFAALTYAKYQSFGLKMATDTDISAERDSILDSMYSQARSLIPDELGTFEIGHIQALLILGLTNLGLGRFSAAWYLIGQAARVALDLGLDNRSSEGKQNIRPNTRGKIVFLGCFALDTIVSARLARVPHLTSSSVNKVGYADEDGLEEWDPWTDCLNVQANVWSTLRGPATILSTFNRLLKVLQFLNDCICSSKRSRNPQVAIELTERLKKLDLYQTPPFHNEVQSAADSGLPALLPHHYHLRMAYFNTLTASQLLSHHQSKVGSNLEPCVNSARGITDLLVKGSEAYGSAIIPPTFEYFMKTAYDVVDAVRSSIENTHIVLDDWKQDLDNCMDAMDSSWPAIDSLKSSSPYQPKSSGRRESEVAFELISGSIAQAADTPQSQMTQNSSKSHTAVSPWNQFQYTSVTSPIFPRQAEGNSTRHPSINTPGQTIPERRQSAARSPVATPSFNSQKGQASPFAADVSATPDLWSMPNRNQHSVKSNTSIDPTQPPSISTPNALPKGPEVDSESMFNEFATLDAMQCRFY